MADLNTRYGGGAEVTSADDVVTDAVSLFKQTKLGHFTMTVRYVVQTYRVMTEYNNI